MTFFQGFIYLCCFFFICRLALCWFARLALHGNSETTERERRVLADSEFCSRVCD
jgi:hypothetical protein